MTQEQTQQDRPRWTPAVNFPVDLETARLETRLGALIAVLEHQQVQMLRVVDATVADRYLRSISTSPALHLPAIMQLAHHHEARGRKDGRGRTHGRILDGILKTLPIDLPKFVPATRRWEITRAYRIVRDHMESTHVAYRLDFSAWKALKEARGEQIQEDPDALPPEDSEAAEPSLKVVGE
jgi:hypothetical protein